MTSFSPKLCEEKNVIDCQYVIDFKISSSYFGQFGS